MGLWWWIQPTLGNEIKNEKNKISDLTGFEPRGIGISIAEKPKINKEE